jgi:hypothetical protein
MGRQDGWRGEKAVGRKSVGERGRSQAVGLETTRAASGVRAALEAPA